jgi:choline dehydrogenase-like flavoprotein
MVLAERGMRVLILERGDHQTFANEPRDHLRNHRLSQYGNNTGPELEGNPRVLVDSSGREHLAKPNDGHYQNIASGVGSGTVVYGGQAWRFLPNDFRMASTYGVPEGSSLVDWPFPYEELASHYEAVEHAVGVSGGVPHAEMPARADYPMPAVPLTHKGRVLDSAARTLGWNTGPVPVLINSVPRDGRPACAQCQHCVGFACPNDAKNGTHNTAVPRALRTGNATLKTHAVVTSIRHSGGRATGVDAVIDGVAQSFDADRVVIAASAIESARLLLLSGVANEHDQIGRHLQGHVYAGAWGLMDEVVYDGVGPGVSISTVQFNHGNDGIVGGGMLADDFVVLPITFVKRFRTAGVPARGQAYKDWVRHAFPRFIQVMGPVHEIPNPLARVELDPVVKDRYGLPVARLSGTVHDESVRTANFMNERAAEWLGAAGAKSIVTNPHGKWLSAGQHQAGTCRMGDDPRASVTDPFGRVHSMANMYVADGSLHPTNGGFNPVLSIMANAHRVAKHMT